MCSAAAVQLLMVHAHRHSNLSGCFYLSLSSANKRYLDPNCALELTLLMLLNLYIDSYIHIHTYTHSAAGFEDNACLSCTVAKRGYLDVLCACLQRCLTHHAHGANVCDAVYAVHLCVPTEVLSTSCISCCVCHAVHASCWVHACRGV